MNEVTRGSLAEIGDEVKATRVVDKYVRESRGPDSVSFEGALSNDFAHISNVPEVNASQNENSVQEENGRGVESHGQSAQEGSGCANVAILLAATSDRRKFLDEVCRRAGGGGVREGHPVGKQGSCGVSHCRQEMMFLEHSTHLDMSGLNTDLNSKEAEIDGRDESDSKPSDASNREQASSLGSSLVGESVGSWLATTSDDLVAINTTKESVAKGKSTSVKPAKPKSRVSFANEVTEVLTWGPMEYDRKNRDVDPASAAVEWELEKNVARLETLQVELERGSEGLGLAIMGLGAGRAELGLEKLGIFIKSVTPGGVAAKDGRVKEGDQIIEVNGQSLVGVTQTHAATVLRAALGTVSFLLGREKVVEQQHANHQHEQVQVEESQTTVSPESSALEEEEEDGFDFSPD